MSGIKQIFWVVIFVMISILLLNTEVFSKINSIKSSSELSGVSNLEELNPTLYYVVIGSFMMEDNARRFAGYVDDQGYKASYTYNPRKSMFYVFTYTSTDIEDTRSKRNYYRNNTEFSEAWMFTLNKVEATDPELTAKADQETEYVADIPEPVEDPEPIEESITSGDKLWVYFNVVAAKKFKEIPAHIRVVDSEKAKLLTRVKSHKVVEIPTPDNSSGNVQLICEVFGYRKVEHTFNVSNPVNETNQSYVKMKNDTVFVDFELWRHKAGDVLVMYNVFFFDDASVMMSKSMYELNSLLEMLKENDSLKVRIHGHTNGNSFGRIIKLKDDDSNFFKVTNNNRVTVGSATELSELRAATIKRYLTHNGIENSRMEVKGWGGKRMLYESDGPLAKKNVRVEIEIIKD